MDEDNSTVLTPAQTGDVQPPEEGSAISVRNRPFVIITVFLALLAVVVLIAAVASNSEKSGQNRMDDARDLADFINYEAQAGRVFGMASGRVVTASCVETAAYDSKGRVSYQEPFEAQTPALDCSGGMAVAYDSGGTSLRVFSVRKTVAEYTSTEKIISACVNENGWSAVCTLEEGYKGSVTVLNNRAEAVYKWSSAGGYVFTAALSPDNRNLAVVTLHQDGDEFYSAVNLFSLSSEEQQGSYKLDNSIALAVKYGRNGIITCLAEDRAVILNSAGEEQGVYKYAGRTLNCFSLEAENYFVLSLSRTYTDTYSEIVAVDFAGRELGRANVMGTVRSLSAGRDTVAVLLNDSMAMFTSLMEENGGLTSLSGAKNVFLDPDENAIILGHISAKLYER